MRSGFYCNFQLTKLFFLLFIIAAGNFKLSASTTNGQTISIYTEELAPYNFMDGNQLTGMNIELVRALCERAKLDCQINILPWNRAFRNAQTQDGVGLVSVARTPEREKLFHWVGPLAFSHGCYFKSSKRNDIVIKNDNELLNYTVGYAKNLVYQKHFEERGFKLNENLILYDTRLESQRAFLKGRYDLIVASINTLPHQIKEQGGDIFDMVPAYPFIDDTYAGNYLAFNLNTDKGLISKLNELVLELKENGKFDKIVDQFRHKEYIEYLRNTLPESLKKLCL